MRVLILGGTGAMGVPLVEMYSRAGYEVFLTSRSRHQDERNSVVYLQGNALDINWLCSIVKSNVYDAVVDFMVRKLENLQETLNLILPRTAQYIFISSARVYAQTDGLITEDTPRLLDVCTDSEYVKSDEYAIVKAKEENYDVVLIDTAGRLQNKVNLMNELAKMNKVIGELVPGAPHETLLVIDATTGQNGISQAKSFKEITNIPGIVLTKLDGTAKVGIVLAIKEDVNIPVKYIGLGETKDDLQIFDIEKYIYGLFKDFV